MYTNEIYHHGVDGQKWGVKNGPPYPLDKGMSPRKAASRAKKDAKEFARAKMFYGEGAGTRRKRIRNVVNERSKDPNYKRAFDEALSKQDMAKHVQKAKAERARKDTANQVKKTGRGLVNIVTGHPERVGAALAVVAAGVGIAHKTGADKIVVNAAKTKIRELKEKVNLTKARNWIKNNVIVVNK